MNFENSLHFGRVGESDIANWLRSRGVTVLPVYEIEKGRGKGPQLFTPNDELIAPDMLTFGRKGTLWIEAKHKTAFSWHRISQRWVTGIDLRHYEHYCRVADGSPYGIWLLFLQEGGKAKDSPPCSLTGLYGGDLAVLRNHENHRHENGGKNGMVYWAPESCGGPLKLIVPLASVRNCQLRKAS